MSEIPINLHSRRRVPRRIGYISPLQPREVVNLAEHRRTTQADKALLDLTALQHELEVDLPDISDPIIASIETAKEEITTLVTSAYDSDLDGEYGTLRLNEIINNINREHHTFEENLIPDEY